MDTEESSMLEGGVSRRRFLRLAASGFTAGVVVALVGTGEEETYAQTPTPTVEQQEVVDPKSVPLRWINGGENGYNAEEIEKYRQYVTSAQEGFVEFTGGNTGDNYYFYKAEDIMPDPDQQLFFAINPDTGLIAPVIKVLPGQYVTGDISIIDFDKTNNEIKSILRVLHDDEQETGLAFLNNTASEVYVLADKGATNLGDLKTYTPLEAMNIIFQNTANDSCNIIGEPGGTTTDNPEAQKIGYVDPSSRCEVLFFKTASGINENKFTFNSTSGTYEQ